MNTDLYHSLLMSCLAVLCYLVIDIPKKLSCKLTTLTVKSWPQDIFIC